MDTVETTMERPNTDELNRRNGVYALKQKVVLVKLLAVGRQIPGIPEKTRDNTAVEAQHKVEAKKLEVNFNAYRNGSGTSGTGDTGKMAIPKTRDAMVNLGQLIQGLQDMGLTYRECFWQKQGHKGKVYTFVFASEHEKPSADFPNQDVRDLLLYATWKDFNALWANQKFDENGVKYRLDTVQVAAPQDDTPKKNNIVLFGKANHTYRLIPV